jgi:MOSC domain-containing protein YiiM
MTHAPEVDLATIAVAAVNVGRPAVIGRRGDEPVTSAIAKQAVPAGTTLSLSTLNLSGDAQADLTVHGGPDKAVYAYPSEHLPLWAEELGGPLGPAPFGENLSTVGVTESDAGIGDRWAWGAAVLEVCQPRSPCFKLAMHRGRGDMAKRFKDSGRSGWYLRVLTPGEVPVDGPITVVERHPSGLTIADANRAWADRHGDDLGLIRALAEHDRLADEWRLPFRERLRGRE